MVRFPYKLHGMASNTERIANRVRGLAAEHRLTQQRIAEVLGISRTSVGERFNGRVPFTATEMLALANEMGLPVARLYPEPHMPALGSPFPAGDPRASSASASGTGPGAEGTSAA